MKGKIGAAILGVAFVGILGSTIMCTERIPTGYDGVVYSMSGGVQDEILGQGWHVVAPTKKVKKFTIGNEQLLLTKDEREGSEEDESSKVSTADDANIAISFQMSYRFKEDTLVDTYKRFKGMDGEDIVNRRVKTVLKSKVSEVTTSHSMMDIYSGNRAQINSEITEYLNKSFGEAYGLEVLDASIGFTEEAAGTSRAGDCKSGGGNGLDQSKKCGRNQSNRGTGRSKSQQGKSRIHHG